MPPHKKRSFSPSLANLESFGRARFSSASKTDAQYPFPKSNPLGGGERNKSNKQNKTKSEDAKATSPSSNCSGILQAGSCDADEDAGEGDGNSSAEADDTDDDDPEAFAPSRVTPDSRGRRQLNSATQASRYAKSRRETRGGRLDRRHGMGRNSRATTKHYPNNTAKRSLSKVARDSDDRSPGSGFERLDRKRARNSKNGGNASPISEYIYNEPGENQHVSETHASPSDDDEYDGVDLISDSDPDNPTVDNSNGKLVEQTIFEAEDLLFAEVPHLSVAADLWDDFQFRDGFFLHDVPHFQEQLARGEDIDEEDVELFKAALYGDSPSESSQLRRVRFKDEVSGSASTSTIDTNGGSFYPDLFVPRDRFAPFVQNESSDSNPSHTYCALEKNNKLSVEDGIFEGGNNSRGDQPTQSDSETDEGETTDEDLSLTAARNNTRNNSHCRSTSSPALNACHSAHKTTTTSSSSRKGPSLASWTADPTRPYAILNSAGKHIVILPSRNPLGVYSSGSSATDTSPRTSFASFTDDGRSVASNEDLDHINVRAMLLGEMGSESPTGSAMPNSSYDLFQLGLQSNGQKVTQINNHHGEGHMNLNDFLCFPSDSDNDSDQTTGGREAQGVSNPTFMDFISDSPEDMPLFSEQRPLTAFRRNQVRSTEKDLQQRRRRFGVSERVGSANTPPSAAGKYMDSNPTT